MTHTPHSNQDPHAAGGLAQIIDTHAIRVRVRNEVADASLAAQLLTLANGYDELLVEQAGHVTTMHHQSEYLEGLRVHLSGVQQIIDRWVAEEETT